MDKQLLSRLTTAVEHYLSNGLTEYGDKAYAVPISRQCYEVNKAVYVHAVDGTRKVARKTLYFDTLLVITHNDQMNVNGRSYPVIAFELFSGLDPTTGTTVVYV